MVDVKELIGKQIKTLRQAKGLSQEELATMISMNSKYLSGIERGKANPTLGTLMKMADALTVDVSEFFSYEHEKMPQDLAQLISGLIAQGDQSKLRLAAKVLNAICR
jgi:transcriptional regulator with XRE-family HTH domain